MKKKEIIIVIGLILFGLIYQSFSTRDYGIFKKGKLTFESTRLARVKPIVFTQEQKKYSGLKEVWIENPAGEIVVTPSEEKSVSLKVIGKVYRKEFHKAETIWKNLKIEEQLGKSGIKWIVRYKKEFPYDRLRVLLLLSVPPDLNLNLINSFGKMSVTGVSGKLNIEQNFGDLVLDSITAPITAKCGFAHIYGRGLKGGTFLNMEQSKASVTGADAISVQGKYGEVDLNDISSSANIDYSYGYVEIHGASKVDARGKHTGFRMSDIKESCKIQCNYENVDVIHAGGSVVLNLENCDATVSESHIERLDIQNTHNDIQVRRCRIGEAFIQQKNGKVGLELEALNESLNLFGKYTTVYMNVGNGEGATYHLRSDYGRILNQSGIELIIQKNRIGEIVDRIAGKPEISIELTYGDLHLKKSE